MGHLGPLQHTQLVFPGPVQGISLTELGPLHPDKDQLTTGAQLTAPTPAEEAGEEREATF